MDDRLLDNRRMIELWKRMPTATEFVARLTRREIEDSALYCQCVARIEQMDLFAWVPSEQPVAWLGDHLDGPLSEVVIGIKDIIDVQLLETKAGAPGNINPARQHDAPIVARLRIADALIAGKTVTCQYACFDPAPTLNPWNVERTPGGSSAGSAVAVALGQCLIALGTQTGGSIIRPASYCGVCGFKPSFDPQWQEGVIPVSNKLDHVGPLARCVDDLELAWRAIVGQEKVDPHPLPRGEGARIGVLREYFWEHASDDVRAVTNAAIEKLRERGANVKDVPLPPGFSEVHAAHRVIMAFDCARYHAEAFERSPQSYLPRITSLIREGLAIPPSVYAAAVRFQSRFFRSRLLAAYPDIDALVMPSTNTTAPTRETTGDPRFQSPWSFAGVPAVTIPCGLAADGMPCGLQIVRPHGLSHDDDFALLALARWCEAQLEVNLWPELNRRLQQQFPDIQWIDPP